MEAKYVKFELQKQGEKTSIYNVVSKEGDIVLGVIKWFGRWRCYSFMPNANTVFEKVCMRDIANFLEFLMEKRKNKNNG